jgi:hypothetical protein
MLLFAVYLCAKPSFIYPLFASPPVTPTIPAPEIIARRHAALNTAEQCDVCRPYRYPLKVPRLCQAVPPLPVNFGIRKPSGISR